MLDLYQLIKRNIAQNWAFYLTKSRFNKKSTWKLIKINISGKYNKNKKIKKIIKNQQKNIKN